MYMYMLSAKLSSYIVSTHATCATLARYNARSMMMIKEVGLPHIPL
jgi:hypothetical protein